MEQNKTRNSAKTIRIMARVAIFGAIATILYVVPFFTFSVPFFPGFLQFHFDEIPAFIAGFAYGPLTGFFVLLVKTLIKLPFSTTAFVGEAADLLYSSAFVIPAALIYKKNRSIAGALFGFGLGFICQLIASSLGNMFFMIDFYVFFMGFPADAILAMGQAANSNITDIHYTMVLYGILPFNVVKDFLVVLVTFLIYKRIHILISKKL